MKSRINRKPQGFPRILDAIPAETAKEFCENHRNGCFFVDRDKSISYASPKKGGS
jgi:hypothetical protein